MQAQTLEDYAPSADTDVFVLRQDFPIPENLKDNQVLVQMKAASVNPGDNHLKSGNIKMLFKLKFPCVLGKDGSGVVVKVGSKVTQFKEGDEVCGGIEGVKTGTFAQYCVFSETDLIKKPTIMTHTQAAAFPIVGGTILEGFKSHPKLEKLITREIENVEKLGRLSDPTPKNERENFRILIIGASGGTGSTAVLFAKQFLSRYLNLTIYAVCSERNVEMVKALGADVTVDYTKTSAKAGSQKTHKKSGLTDMPSICQVIKNEHAEDAVDFVLDTVGGYYYYDDVHEHLHCKGNRVIFASFVPPGPPVLSLGTMVSTGCYLAQNGVKSALSSAYPKYKMVNYFGKQPKALDFLMNHVLTMDNAFERLPLTQFPLSDLNEGFKLISSRRSSGKVVINIPDIKGNDMQVREVEL
ncbi:hypothetical protein ABK040_005087 [Willaertia magna]